MGQTITGTRSYYFFKSVNSNAYKRTAEDDALSGSVNITGEAYFGRMTTESVHLDEYVASRYDEKWWISDVKEVDRVEQDQRKVFTGQENLMSAGLR